MRVCFEDLDKIIAEDKNETQGLIYRTLLLYQFFEGKRVSYSAILVSYDLIDLIKISYLYLTGTNLAHEEDSDFVSNQQKRTR